MTRRTCSCRTRTGCAALCSGWWSCVPGRRSGPVQATELPNLPARLAADGMAIDEALTTWARSVSAVPCGWITRGYLADTAPPEIGGQTWPRSVAANPNADPQQVVGAVVTVAAVH
jgi:hypothetical protein